MTKRLQTHRMKLLPMIFCIRILTALFLTASACCCALAQNQPVFKSLSPEETGVAFGNYIPKNHLMYAISEDYVVTGCGMAVADFNNDGKQDVVAANNVGKVSLFLNKGNLKFEEARNTNLAPGEWTFGISAADVNGDGWQDILILKTSSHVPENQKNKLYLNNGDLTFTEASAEWGLDQSVNTTGSAFFDYDQDGDLDLFLVNAPRGGNYSNRITKVGEKQLARGRDMLYENKGDHFEAVTEQRGLQNEDLYGLSCYAGDLNMDGYQDLYVSNDYFGQDMLYYNDGKGNFVWKTNEVLKQSPLFGMGIDVADLNNDLLPEIFSVDMLQESIVRQKEEEVAQNFETREMLIQYKGQDMQRASNSLQYNLGDGRFAEIGRLSGVHATDWSWTPLIFDFDNDGWNDIFISNGVFYAMLTDYIVYHVHELERKREQEFQDMMNSDDYSLAYKDSVQEIMSMNKSPFVNVLDFPRRKTVSYFYQNQKDLTFKNMAEEWGLADTLISTGAAYADFDEDGDIDFLMMNLDTNLTFYENTSAQTRDHNYLQVKLDYGKKGNREARGAKVFLYAGGQAFYREIQSSRGYIACSEPIAHFGLGKTARADSLVVFWPEKLDKQVVLNPKLNDRLTLEYKPTGGTYDSARVFDKSEKLPVKEIPAASVTAEPFAHKEDLYYDSKTQPTILKEFANLGPGLAVGDVNGDKLDDYFIGGAAGQAGKLYLQKAGGKFAPVETPVFAQDEKSEDLGALFFDADADGDLDLYVVSGGSSFPAGDPRYQDRLYFNDGEGAFEKRADAIPTSTASGSAVVGADFDGDGDLDLFVCGRVTPGEYPRFPASALLRNTGGVFEDATDELAPGLKTYGNLSSALWTDYDDDGDPDLMVTGDYLPITIWQNQNGAFKPLVKEIGTELTNGWWNSLVGADFDGDGDTDYMAGNLGLNSRYKASPEKPLRLFGADLDDNGTIDPISFMYNLGEETCIHTYLEISDQCPAVRRKFVRVSDYARADRNQIVPPEKAAEAIKLEAYMFETTYFENRNGKLVARPLAQQAQFAPVFGIMPDDFDGDGNLDALLTGNFTGFKVNNTTGLASRGLILFGDGQGGFAFRKVQSAPFDIGENARALGCLHAGGKKLFPLAVSNGPMRWIDSGEPAGTKTYYKFEDDEYAAEIVFPNGKIRKIEKQFGQGYLSQSCAKFQAPDGAVEIRFHGKDVRTVPLTKP